MIGGTHYRKPKEDLEPGESEAGETIELMSPHGKQSGRSSTVYLLLRSQLV
jgi:hypothetical protein